MVSPDSRQSATTSRQHQHTTITINTNSNRRLSAFYGGHGSAGCGHPSNGCIPYVLSGKEAWFAEFMLA